MERLEAIFSETTDTITLSGLYQWDYGQKLYIKGLNLPDAIEIHFSNSKSREALIMVAVTEGEYTTTEVPNALLEECKDITAYIYYTHETEGKTLKKVILKVEERTKPQDFVSDNPDATDILADVVNKINQNIKDNAEFKQGITEDNTQFKNNLTERQTTFETSIQSQQDQHVKDVNSLVDQRLSGVYRYCGQVPTKNDLPQNAKVGDVYDVADSGVNWAWNGTSWDSLAGIIDLTNYYTKEQTDERLNQKAPLSHTHNEYALKTQLGTQYTMSLSDTTLTITTK